MLRATALALLCACGEGLEPHNLPDPTPPETEATPLDGFVEGPQCAVETVFAVGCVVGCHSALTPTGDLDLETDPYSAVVGVASEAFGEVLVAPGNPGGSLLVRKMEDAQDADEGAPMPPSGTLDAVFVDAVRQWVLDGAPSGCEPGGEQTYEGAEPYHPDGFAEAGAHGREANLQIGDDCRGCHGSELDGGTAAVGCDSCHEPGWRTSCTYCHGAGASGAPPRDIDGETDPTAISFPSHTEHVAGADHPAYDCVECHRKPSDVLTPGHLFDDVTPRYGEIDYTGGISRYATYLGGSCSNTYCHGDGQGDNGTVATGDGPLGCGDCHAAPGNAAGWGFMSGEHDSHLQQGDIACVDCHSGTVDATPVIVDPSAHVDGTADVTLVAVTWSGATCTGRCHNHDHAAANW